MTLDDATRRCCNLVDSDPRFVMRRSDDGARWTVEQVSEIAPDTGFYLVAGKTLLPGGDRIASVFLIHSSGGELHGVYWKTGASSWVDSQDPDALSALGRARAEVFPFNWETAVPVQQDAHHSEIAER